MYDVLECEKHNTAALLFRVRSVSLSSKLDNVFLCSDILRGPFTQNTFSVVCNCSIVFFSCKHALDGRAVVLESGLGLESGLETFFYRLGLVLDSDLSRTWSSDSPNVQVGLDRVQQYMLFFFSFKTKTRLFRKWVM